MGSASKGSTERSGRHRRCESMPAIWALRSFVKGLFDSLAFDAGFTCCWSGRYTHCFDTGLTGIV